MTLGGFLLCWSPVVLLMVLAVVFRRPAFDLSLWGVLFTYAVAVVGFQTPPQVAFLSAVDGVLTTLPIILVILGGIMLSNLLMATGSLRRIVDWFMGGVKSAYHRNLLIGLGVCNFMEGASVIAEPVVAPMLRAAGVSPVGSAALSVIGYAGLLTLEMAGIIVTVLAIVTGLPFRELGVAGAWLSVPAVIALSLFVPYYLPHTPGISRTKRLATALACGVLLGISGLLAALYIGISVAGMLAGLVLIAGLVFFGKRRLPGTGGVLRDLSPFMFMLAALMAVNAIPAVKDLFFAEWIVSIKVIPVHTITFRPFFSAYLYLFLAFAVAVFLLKPPYAVVRTALDGALFKGWRVAVSMALFGAMGQVIAYSGYGPGFLELAETRNIPWILSHGMKAYTGGVYPLFVPFLGWVGTFLTGYGVAALMLFGPLQIPAAKLLGVSSVWLSAAIAVGASVGSISSPFKIAIATPMCDAQGREGEILRRTIPVGAGVSLLVGGVLFLFI